MISDKDKQSGISDFNSIFAQNHMPAALSHPISRENHGRGRHAVSPSANFPIIGLRNSERLIAVLKSPLISGWAGFPFIQLMVPVIGRSSPREKNSPLPGMRTHISTKAFPSRFSDCKLAP